MNKGLSTKMNIYFRVSGWSFRQSRIVNHLDTKKPSGFASGFNKLSFKGTIQFSVFPRSGSK